MHGHLKQNVGKKNFFHSYRLIYVNQVSQHFICKMKNRRRTDARPCLILAINNPCVSLCEGT